MNNVKPITMEGVSSELAGITAIMNFIINDLGEECACLDSPETHVYLAKRVNTIYEPALYHIFDSLSNLCGRVRDAAA